MVSDWNDWLARLCQVSVVSPIPLTEPRSASRFFLTVAITLLNRILTFLLLIVVLLLTVNLGSRALQNRLNHTLSQIENGKLHITTMLASSKSKVSCLMLWFGYGVFFKYATMLGVLKFLVASTSSLAFLASNSALSASSCFLAHSAYCVGWCAFRCLFKGCGVLSGV